VGRTIWKVMTETNQ